MAEGTTGLGETSEEPEKSDLRVYESLLREKTRRGTFWHLISKDSSPFDSEFCVGARNEVRGVKGRGSSAILVNLRYVLAIFHPVSKPLGLRRIFQAIVYRPVCFAGRTSPQSPTTQSRPFSLSSLSLSQQHAELRTRPS